MAQKVSFTPDQPLIPDSHPHQRYFHRGDVVNVMRFAGADVAQLDVCFQTRRGTEFANITARLSAAECEAVAGALLDAAHDLRTHQASGLKVAA